MRVRGSLGCVRKHNRLHAYTLSAWRLVPSYERSSSKFDSKTALYSLRMGEQHLKCGGNSCVDVALLTTWQQMRAQLHATRGSTECSTLLTSSMSIEPLIE